MRKMLLLAIVYAAIAFLIYWYGEDILTWLRHTDNLLLIALIAIIMALFPIIPYPVVGGVIGAALGPVMGASITWIGSAAASILMFLYVRYGYREWGARALHRYKGLHRVTTIFQQNAFLAILFARLLPFIPSIIINVYAALSGVGLVAYAVASSLGKVPAMLLFAMVGDNLMSDSGSILTTVTVYGIFLLLSLTAYRLWQKKRASQQAA